MREPSRHRLAAAAAVLIVALIGCSSAPPADEALKRVPIAAAAPEVPTLPAYRLTTGDELDIRVTDAPQYDQTVKVGPDGRVDVSLIGAVPVVGHSPEEVQADLRERFRALAGSDQRREYVIHANDELEIKFPYYDKLNDQMRVRPDGKIQLQLAGTLQAEGLTPEDLQHELRLRYARFLKEPELAVIVRTATTQNVRTAAGEGRAGMADFRPMVSLRSFQAPQVFITGEVARPGMLPFTPGLTLLQLLAEAGGHLPSGDVTQIVILRRSADQSAARIRPDLSRTFRNAPTKDVALQPYDVLIVPPTRAQNLAEVLDRYVYKLFAPLKNSTFGYVYGSTRVY